MQLPDLGPPHCLLLSPTSTKSWLNVPTNSPRSGLPPHSNYAVCTVFFFSILPILYAAEFFSLVQCLYCEFLHACHLPKTALPYDFELQIWPIFKSMCSMILYVMISHWMYEEHNSFLMTWSFLIRMRLYHLNFS